LLRGHGRALRTEERKEDGNACAGVAVMIKGIDFIHADVVPELVGDWPDLA
jgi:hypothetical protein